MSLSVMAGVGGGGIIVSFIMVFCNLDIKDAVAISGFTILVGSLTRFAITFQERHPGKDAVQIDYTLSTVMLPTVLVGSTLGILFNIVFPQVVIQICLTLFLSFMLVQSLFKFKEIYKKENLDLKIQAEEKLEIESDQQDKIE